MADSGNYADRVVDQGKLIEKLRFQKEALEHANTIMECMLEDMQEEINSLKSHIQNFERLTSERDATAEERPPNGSTGSNSALQKL